MFISGLSSTNRLIIAYLNGSIVGSDSIPLGTDFALFNVNLPLANSWTFVSNAGQGPAYWLADDLTFAPATTTTPEPSSLLRSARASWVWGALPAKTVRKIVSKISLAWHG